MIRQLSGTVLDIGRTYVVIDVGGVGYQVHTNAPTSCQLNSPASLFTYLAVRENSLDLYGFLDRDTLEVFELLIDLPKIGPKSALQILTAADISLIKEASRNNDPAHLSKLSGIGKKSAEKIVAGLKDKLEDMAFSSVSHSTAQAGNIDHQSDTIDALIALGYQPQDARRVVIEITSSIEDATNTSAELIRLALTKLNR